MFNCKLFKSSCKYSLVISVLLSVSILAFNAGCSNLGVKSRSEKLKKYSYQFLGSFDTMIEFIGYAESESQFDELVNKGKARFEELHKLYDIYNSYDGINNIKTINDNAGLKPVLVSQDIIDIILFSKEWHSKTGGAVNIAFGPVLSIWHSYRDEGKSNPSEARLPELSLLKEASLNCDINNIEIDSLNKTVFLNKKGMSLDIGAVAKGYATELVTKELKEAGFSSFAISSGGNVRVLGEPKDGIRNKWAIGIQDPDKNSVIPESTDSVTLDTVYISDSSLVTSGDYQRYYIVNGEMIHHIIDPKTLMPANHHRAVTVLTEDSGVADFLSTTLFLLPYEEGRSFVEQMQGVGALWVMPDGSINVTDNMRKMMKKLGGASGKR